MAFVQLSQKRQIVLLNALGQWNRRVQVEDWRPLRVEFCPSVEGWQPTVLSEQGSAGVITLWVAQNEVCRQVLIVGPKTIADPGPQRRPPWKDLAGLQHYQRLQVVIVLGDHGADEANVICNGGGMGEDF